MGASSVIGGTLDLHGQFSHYSDRSMGNASVKYHQQLDEFVENTPAYSQQGSISECSPNYLPSDHESNGQFNELQQRPYQLLQFENDELKRQLDAMKRQLGRENSEEFILKHGKHIIYRLYIRL